MPTARTSAPATALPRKVPRPTQMTANKLAAKLMKSDMIAGPAFNYTLVPGS